MIISVTGGRKWNARCGARTRDMLLQVRCSDIPTFFQGWRRRFQSLRREILKIHIDKEGSSEMFKREISDYVKNTLHFKEISDLWRGRLPLKEGELGCLDALPTELTRLTCIIHNFKYIHGPIIYNIPTSFFISLTSGRKWELLRSPLRRHWCCQVKVFTKSNIFNTTEDTWLKVKIYIYLLTQYQQYYKRS